ncbi:hypothetical protein ANN_20134, partial [Periplaneta americana]
PLNAQEICMKSLSVVECSSNEEVIVKEPSVDGTSRTFAFDRVFGPNSRQCLYGCGSTNGVENEQMDLKIHLSLQRPRRSTYGYFGAIMQDPLSGIIPRTLSNLFDEVGIQQVEHTVRVIFFEVYSEEIINLLSSLNDKTKISKSHAIFSIVVDMKEELLEGEERQKTGQLNLVDLAGSENIGQSGAMDKKAHEAGGINQSLLTIGRVITALVERKSHIPYRYVQ